MTDIISVPDTALRSDDADGTDRLIALLFFAYRDFVQEADTVLSRYDFGRAHHRVLYFVSRNPGLKVAELLQILQITKQSLSRVLRELVEQGFVEANEGVHDRRHRLLRLTEKGEDLIGELTALQARRIDRALNVSGTDARETAERFLSAMINPANREDAARVMTPKTGRA